MTLIDDLYIRTKLDYLSDMHLKRNWKAVWAALYDIPEDKYLKEEWMETYQYITGNSGVGNFGKTELLTILNLGFDEKDS